MKELDTIKKISQVSGKIDKRKILEDNKDDKRLGDLLDASLNFFRKFYIHKWDMPTNSVDIETDQHDTFINLIKRLEARVITGNAAKQCVELFFERCSERQRDIYAKVLRKDLKAGFSVDTAAEFFPIPTFDVMLATDGKKCKKISDVISAGVYVSPKFDGYRCLAVIDNGYVTLYSRNGSIFTNFPAIQQSLAKSFKDMSLILDGEIMSDDFQAMQKTAFSSKSGQTVGDVKYNVFDCLSLNEWKTGKFEELKKTRYYNLIKYSALFGFDVIPVTQELVFSIEKVMELEMTYMKLGFEGAMILPDIPYYKGRSSNKLMKFKTMLSQDCTITGMYEGEQASRLEGMMGGLKLLQENNKVCECGTGFSDNDRRYMWLAQEEFINRIVEIKYQELSKDGIMRFPVFVRFRDNGPGIGKI